MTYDKKDERINVGAGMMPTYHATESVEEAIAVVESCWSANEELRRLLDERGVEWDYGITGATTTRFSVNGIDLTFTPMRDGLVCSTILTPEQAIAATLGSCNCSNNCTNSERTETCHIDLVGYNQHEGRFQCRSCDWSMWFKRGTCPQFNYCPNCGRKVVSNG